VPRGVHLHSDVTEHGGYANKHLFLKGRPA